jgi:hypothetical protein
MESGKTESSEVLSASDTLKYKPHRSIYFKVALAFSCIGLIPFSLLVVYFAREQLHKWEATYGFAIGTIPLFFECLVVMAALDEPLKYSEYENIAIVSMISWIVGSLSLTSYARSTCIDTFKDGTFKW